MIRLSLIIVLFLYLPTLSAKPTDSASPSPKTLPAIVKPADLTDDQIAAIMKEFNDVEMSLSIKVLKKTKNKKIKTFAQMIYDDHLKNFKQVKIIINDEKIVPKPSDLTKKMNTDQAASLKSLGAKKDKDLDQEYIKTQMDLHKEMLNELDLNIIPVAKNVKLKSYLIETRKVVETHLAKVKSIEVKTGK